MVRVHLDPPLPWRGALAQLGERLICIQEVIGSIPIGSTRSSQAVRSDSTFAEVLSRPTGRKLTSFRERNISIAWRSRVWGCLGFDPEGRYCSKSSTLTNQRSRANQPVAWVSTAFDTRPLPRGPQPGRRSGNRPCSFWIKSSAKRAFGGCLGSKRR